MNDIIKLVSESPEAHGVFGTCTETQREVFAEVRSVGYNEFYAAMSAGITPTIQFRIADYLDYQGEKIVVYNTKRYRVVRTYRTGQQMDITVEEATNDR